MFRNSYEEYTYYHDLNVCEDALNIGWIGSGPYKTGVVSGEIINILIDLIPVRVRSLRTQVRCPICGEIPADIAIHSKIYSMGFSEIRVLSKCGTVYAVPDMVFHYIEKHSYQLPFQFLSELKDAYLPKSLRCQDFHKRFSEEYCWGKSEEEMAVIEQLIRYMHSNNKSALQEIFQTNPKAVNSFLIGGSLLNTAVETGNLSMVKFLIENDELDIRRFGGTELYNAVTNDQISIAEILLDAGIPMNIQCPEMNPLYAAIECENLDMVKLLIAKGFDFRVQYKDEDRNALAYAQSYGADDIAQYLLQLL